MRISPEAAKALTALNYAGFEAYVVGGCVRDSLLGKSPQDFDVATNANPEQVKSCFSGEKIIETGIKHGTVTAVIDGKHIEITSYRIDGGYSDGRRPDAVAFTDSLKDDLSRRDFTINAIAYHPDRGLIDYFGGQNDIKNRVIKCVGDAETRFSEDALRILRAVRFASTLGFDIEQATRSSIEALAWSLKKISAERIFSELCKTLTGCGIAGALRLNTGVFTEIIPELAPMEGFDQHSKYHCFDVLEHTVKAVESSQNDLTIRMAMLFHDIGKPCTFTIDCDGEGHFHGHAGKGAEITGAVLTRLRCDNELKRRVAFLVEHHHDEIIPEYVAVKRALNKMGEEPLRQLIKVKRADSLAKAEAFRREGEKELNETERVLNEIVTKKEAFDLKSLAINGHDLTSMGFRQGEALGNMLKLLLDEVIEGRLINERGALIREAQKYLK